jgi:hypothetical protein
MFLLVFLHRLYALIFIQLFSAIEKYIKNFSVSDGLYYIFFILNTLCYINGVLQRMGGKCNSPDSLNRDQCSYVYTLFGAFLPTDPCPSLSSLPPSLPGRTYSVLFPYFVEEKT